MQLRVGNMISRNTEDYIKVYPNFLSKELCESAVKSLEKIDWNIHSFYSFSTNSYKSFENELSISNQDFKEKPEIFEKLWFAVNQYVVNDFSDFSGWFGGWHGYTPPRFNRYTKDTEMKLHCDHIQSMFDGERKGIPTLTILGLLNDDYEGGELMMFGDKKIDLHPGSVVVFPSNFMFPHEVKPVLSGVRYSYVSWVW